MLYISVDENDFIRAFEQAGRGDQFSREALETLFSYYDEFDEDIELDVVALCCDWTEESAEDALETAGHDIPEEWEDMDDDEKAEYVAEALEFETVAYALDNGNVLYLAF